MLSPRGCQTYLMLSLASGILTKGQMRCFWEAKLNLSCELYNEFINGIQIKQLKISLHISLYFCNSSCMQYKYICSSCLRAFIKKCRFFFSMQSILFVYSSPALVFAALKVSFIPLGHETFFSPP